jgi:hypothetical protein
MAVFTGWVIHAVGTVIRTPPALTLLLVSVMRLIAFNILTAVRTLHLICIIGIIICAQHLRRSSEMK